MSAPDEPFRVLTPSEYHKLSVEQKLDYLKTAFRQRVIEPERPVSDEAARQSQAAESKI